eukprot:1191008-Prorocentrum_minimum.AAC.3
MQPPRPLGGSADCLQGGGGRPVAFSFSRGEVWTPQTPKQVEAARSLPWRVQGWMCCCGPCMCVRRLFTQRSGERFKDTASSDASGDVDHIQLMSDGKPRSPSRAFEDKRGSEGC